MKEELACVLQSLKVLQTLVSGDRINHFLTASNSKRNSINNSIAESGTPNTYSAATA